VATHASAEKRYRQNLVRRERNRQLRSQLRGALKSVRQALDESAADGLGERLTGVQALIDRMVAKGIIHRNAAARYKARLAARAAKASLAAA